MKLGIVGLPNVGKSTLFNAITKAGAECANYPFCTIEPNIGVVAVPDERLKMLGDLYSTKKITPAVVEFVDIAGLVKGASRGEGLGNKFLSHIREVDAIVHVVRCYDNVNIVHTEGFVDPIRDVQIIEQELILSDLETLEKRKAKTEKQIKANEKGSKEEMELIHAISNHLENEQPLRTMRLTIEQRQIIKDYFLLTEKPVIYVANISENDLGKPDNAYVEKLKSFVGEQTVISICAKIENELSELSDEDKKLFIEELNIEESGLEQLIKLSYDILGQISFLTAGEKEVRAWTITKGDKAPQAAGKIHTDFEKGFIKAEVVDYQDLVSYGGYIKAKEKGKVRIEGKDYVVKDGDVMLFRFNV